VNWRQRRFVSTSVFPTPPQEAHTAQPDEALRAPAIVVPTADGREIRLRRITEPREELKALLGTLALVCQIVSNFLANVVQTRRSPEPIFNGLGFDRFGDEPCVNAFIPTRRFTVNTTVTSL
jgi:hypothetical protein